MLSRKQKWKMVAQKPKKINYNDSLKNGQTIRENMNPSYNENLFSFLFPSPKQNITKSVSFSNYVNVTLIPQSCEYIAADLSERLWYSHDDLDLFKKIRIEEILKERQELKESKDAKYATI